MVDTESSHKTIDLCVKWFSLMKGDQLRCFFLSWKCIKNRSKLRNNFGLISGFWNFFFLGLLRPLMGLLRCIKCFLGGLGQNELKNKFLDKKKLQSWFFCHYSSWDIGKSDDTLSDLIFLKTNWGGLFVPCAIKKLRAQACRPLLKRSGALA
jgi:hypothetical protein